MAALALSAFAASAASANAGLFTANVGENEFAEIHAEQAAGTTDTFTINGLSLTCATANATGFAESLNEKKEEVHLKGPSATYVTLTPKYETCHVNVLFVTRTVTVTHNGCYYTLNATKNTNSTPFSADLHIKCPAGKTIEVHVYNTSNPDDTGAAMLCTYNVVPQTILNSIELTNEKNPTPDDVIAHVNAAVTVENTIKSGTCGLNAHETAIYKGKQTIRATNELSKFVNTTVS